MGVRPKKPWPRNVATGLEHDGLAGLSTKSASADRACAKVGSGNGAMMNDIEYSVALRLLCKAIYLLRKAGLRKEEMAMIDEAKHYGLEIEIAEDDPLKVNGKLHND
jgi:hypothetical protein